MGGASPAIVSVRERAAGRNTAASARRTNAAFSGARGAGGERAPRRHLAATPSAGAAVMGTLARTGIPCLLIGNTAQRLGQRFSCSRLAVEPAGFISPITVESA